jgi:polyisoprenoid-binding protein YceI
MINQNREKINPKVLKEWAESGKAFLLVDVLPEEYFNQKHIKDAKNACVYEVAFLDKIKAMNPSASTPIVVYGERDGFMASASAFTKLINAGYSNVFELEGGIEAWEKLESAQTTEKAVYTDPALHQNKQKVKIDTEKSKITWTGRNLGNLHFGYLQLSNGEIEITDGKIKGGEFTIDMNSIACEDIKDSPMNKMLVEHLLSADFFETARFPQATFKITSAELLKNASPGSPNYKITGDLTMKEITNPITFNAVIGWNTEATFFAQAAFEIDRTKWNVMYGSGRFFERLGMHLVNDYITLQLFITAK